MKDLGENSGAFVAVTGMAGRFPGARNLAEFWRNLRDGVESICRLSDEQLRAAGVAQAEFANPNYVRAAAILDGLDLFDASFFGLSPKDAAIMDPQYRHFLECAWEALENAGWCPDRFDGRIAVYAGSGMNSYLIHNLLKNPELIANAGLFLLRQTGNDKDVLATRVSYQLNLTGPSLAVQTACSTSLVAVHLACQSLLNHECDMALAGGVTIEVPHGVGYVYREGEILSRDGHCRAFDAGSSGTIFGSGLGIVVLRRLEDAMRDGDFIYAIIRGTAINNDGARKVGYLAPSVAGQSEAIVEALGVAGVDADSISYVECHGTGTTVGDPIEIKALTSAFRHSTERSGFCAIGSVKTNIGHLDAAAGIAGLIKTVLALQHRQIPSTLNFSKTNPLIDFEGSPFFPNTELREWKAADNPRRAGVTSLGIGGTNAHAVLEEAPASTPSGDSRPFQLVTLSAKTESALAAQVRNLTEYLADDPGKLADVAYTYHLGRKEFPLRRAIVCSDIADAVDAIGRRDPKKIISGSGSNDRPVVFLFSGQGAQFVKMGVDLYRSESEFRSIIDFCADFLTPHLGLDLRTILFPAEENADAAERMLGETWLTQPALFVVEHALARLWLSWGIRPKSMFGHSIGELAAACTAGVFPLETALRFVAERGRLMQSMPAGAMAAVSLPEEKVTPLLGNKLSLAAVNSEDQCVVSGPEALLGKLEKALFATGVVCSRLRVSHAFHSSMMDPIVASFEEFVRGFQLAAPQVPYVSSLTGTWITDAEATDPSYWARQLRHAVRFSGGVGELLNDSDAVLLEIGPGNTLSALATRHRGFADTNEVISSMRSRSEPVSDSEALIRAIAKMWVAGKRIDWQAFHSHEQRRRLPLPSYPFERKRFWIEPGKPNLSAELKPSEPERREGTTPGAFRPIWKRADLAADPDSIASGPWLIFRDSEGLGARIVESLRNLGEHCTVITPGKSFARISDDEFQIDAGNPSDYTAMLSELGKGQRLPRSIVHLWSVSTSNRSEQPLDELSNIETLSFYSLLFLAQALGVADLDGQIQLGVVSNKLHRVADEAVWRFERSLLMGPCGVIPKEFSNIQCRNIDVILAVKHPSANGHVAEALRDAASQVIGELRSSGGDSPVAYRNGRRWVRTFAPLETASNAKAIAFRKDGVYLITGGLGGIGLVLAEAIAGRNRSRFVLTGRSEFPRREEWDEWSGSHREADPVALKIRKIKSIEAMGSEVLVVAADTADLEAMRYVAAQTHSRFGAINGIIHAAGVLEDAPILQKDASSAARVFAPKVRGTLVLHSIFAVEPLDFAILMSSISATISPAGQIDYAAANGFLDAFAGAQKISENCTTIAIQWPRWRDVGMAADAAADRDEPPIHPLLHKVINHTANEIEYLTKLKVERDWIVGEHRLKNGVGLFPGTGYIEMVRAAVAARFGKKELIIRDLLIKAPLRIEPGVEQTVRLLMRKEGRDYRLSFGTESMECAEGWLSIDHQESPRIINVESVRKRCSLGKLQFDFVKQNQLQARFIDFGPRWRNLRRVYIGRGEALSEVELVSSVASDLTDYSVHPALLDMATGAALFLIEGYNEVVRLYVPVAYSRVILRDDLHAKCYSHLRIKSGASAESNLAEFDISVCDELGNVLVDIDGLCFHQVVDPAGLERGFVRTDQVTHPPTCWTPDSTPAVARDRWLEGISSADGVRDFEAILANPQASNVIVFPDDLLAFLAKPGSKPRAAKPQSLVLASDRPPQDELESMLARWWKELLGVEAVSIKQDFFQLGGDSLGATRLFAKVQKQYGIKLQPATIFTASTIESLARIIRNEEAPSNTSLIVPIQPRGSRYPLFIIPDLTGNVLSFRELVKYLDNEQPVYGIQSPSFSESNRTPLRLEELAANYLVEIREIQPSGPYSLLGHSFGGTVVFEIAQQLHVAGEEVGFLGLLDTWERGYALRFLRTRSQQSRRDSSIVHSRRRQLLYFKTAVVTWIRQRTNELPKRALDLIYGLFRASNLPLPRILNRPLDVNRFVYERYRPRPYPGRIVLFRANDDVLSRNDYALGWSSVAEKDVETYDVPGDHLTLLREPNVRVLAKKVTICLAQGREIRDRDSSGAAAAIQT
jgi:acyl transferase domain-containing protein/thioesterase domain-containing protein/acyl carrier protein